MITYALDSNMISYYLKDVGRVAENINDCLISGNDIAVAPIAYYEVKRGLAMIGSHKRMEKFETLCKIFPVGRLDNDMLDIAVEIYAKLRSEGRIIEDADIFMAAFCLRHQYTLVTHNTRHFINLPDLSIADWAG